MIRQAINLLIVYFLAIVPSFAQEALPISVQSFYCSARAEILGGLNLAKQSAEDLSESESHTFKPGVHLGFRVYAEIGRGFNVSAGMLFEQKGNAYEYSYADNPFPEFMPSSSTNVQSNAAVSAPAATASENGIDRKTGLSYLSFPLLVGYRVLPNKSLNLIAGLNPGLLLGHKTKTDSFGSESEVSGTDDLSTIDVGLVIGAAYLFNGHIGVNAFYDHGLVNIAQAEFAPDAYNRAIKIGVFYRLNFNPFFKESYKQNKLLNYN